MINVFFVVIDKFSKFGSVASYKNKTRQIIKVLFEKILISLRRKPSPTETNFGAEILNKNFTSFHGNE